MKQYTYTFALALLAVPMLVSGQGLADGNTGNFGEFITGLTDLVNNFLIPFLIALCVLAFIYGVFKFFILGSSDEEARASGRSMMLYALIGFVAIVALWAIVGFLAEAFGFESGAGPLDSPSGPKAAN